jgi:hypothetical protein
LEGAIFIEDFPYMPSTKFQFIWEGGFKGDFFTLNVKYDEILKEYGFILRSKPHI